MRIGIITYSWAQNWGALLQAYALMTFLNNQGYETKLINYREFDTKLISTVKSFSDLIVDLFTITASKRRIDHFNAFRNEDLIFTKKCNSTAELTDLNSVFDVFITGSDQVWNVGLGVCKDFYLEFAYEDKKKISYAASFGISEIPEKYRAETILGLRNIDFISVREQSGARIVKNLLGIEPSVVLDPVFLLKEEQWKSFFSTINIKYKNYIFVYPTQVTKTLVDCVKIMKKKTGLIAISPFYVPGCKIVKDIGPKEFVKYIFDSKLVIASSFHATAFSLLFNRNILCITHSQTGSRTTDLLSSLNLQSRIITNLEQLQVLPEINWKDVNKIITEKRIYSVNFLFNSINGEKNGKY